MWSLFLRESRKRLDELQRDFERSRTEWGIRYDGNGVDEINIEPVSVDFEPSLWTRKHGD